MKEDRWFWLDDEKGVYTVKSGYKSVIGLINSSATSQVEFNWQKLWNLLIPPKVKNFIWRAYYNCLPTLDNFQRRQVDVNYQCSVCQAGDETLNHAMWTCLFVRRCCDETSLDYQFFDGKTTTQILRVVFETWKNNDIELLSMIVWGM